MQEPLAGVKVLEVAAWTFVPAAGAVLSDWGADVIKVEHPEMGDPQRGLVAMGIIPGGDSAVNYIIEQPNRGKRSIGLDISTPEGLEILHRLVEQSDVFLTSFLPQVRRKLKIDVEDIRKVNPRIVYVRGSGQGVRGPDAEMGGYDGASYWGRGGIGHALTPKDLEYPIAPRAAFGDLPGGMTIAGGIAAALFARERTGEAPVVDVSLLSCAAWTLSPDIIASQIYDKDPIPKFDRTRVPNPLVNTYKTSDNRHIIFIMMQGDRFWPEFCERIGRPDLLTDERFADGAGRFANAAECVAEIDATMQSKTLAEWKAILHGMKGVWAPMQAANEIPADEQVVANGYVIEVAREDGVTFPLVANPVQFDETPPSLTRAPDHGEHTDEILQELGFDWDEIIARKTSGAVL